MNVEAMKNLGDRLQSELGDSVMRIDWLQKELKTEEDNANNIREQIEEVEMLINMSTTVKLEMTGRKIAHPPSCGSCHGQGCPEFRLVNP